LLLFIKGPLEEGCWLLLLGLYFGGLFAFEYWEEAFTLGLLVWDAFGRVKNY
jgi:hypothetical protein